MSVVPRRSARLDAPARSLVAPISAVGIERGQEEADRPRALGSARSNRPAEHTATLKSTSSRVPRPGWISGADLDQPSGGRAIVIGCGALARELLAVAERIPGLHVACLSPDLHNRPGGIPAAVGRR